jgi:hypothetical protein
MSDINIVGKVLFLQHCELVAVWQSDGPDAVKERLAAMDPELVQGLVMAHVGVDATSF